MITPARFLLASLLLAGCAPLQPVQPMQNTNTGSVQQTSQGIAGEEDVPTSATTTGAVIVAERVLPTGTLEVGSADAPISMMLFTNHACAYCRDFQEDLMPRLMADYVSSGRVRITVVPYLLRKYSDSDQAALSLVCAAQQDDGMAMHELLFQENIGSSTFRTRLTEIGIDQAALQTCMESDGARATVDALQSLATSLDVSLVPTYFINGTKYTGLPEYADLRGQIGDELKN